LEDERVVGTAHPTDRNHPGRIIMRPYVTTMVRSTDGACRGPEALCVLFSSPKIGGQGVDLYQE